MGILKNKRARLRSKARRGFRGFPAATIAFYGPNANFASKIAVGIVRHKGQEPEMHRFFSDTVDLRENDEIGEQVLDLLKREGILSVAMLDRIIGCPHEEGVDFPEGEKCPRCPFWASRDRFTHETIQ